MQRNVSAKISETGNNLNLEVISSLVNADNKTLEWESKDLKQFLARLKTFIPSLSDSGPRVEKKWLCKPNAISPSVCAKFGWVCSGKDMIKCVTCKQMVCCKLPPSWEMPVYKECVKEIVKKLKNAHSPHCPWLTNPNPDRFCVMEIQHKSNILTEFHHRLEGLLKNSIFFPEIELSTELKPKWKDDYYGLITKHFNLPTDSSVNCVILALTGWEGLNESHLQCESCLRNVSTTLYVTKNPYNEDSNSENVESAPKKLKRSLFDPIYEHRDWCKWLRPGSNSTEEKEVYGWEMYLEFIITHVREKNVNVIATKEDIQRASNKLDEFFSSLERN